MSTVLVKFHGIAYEAQQLANDGKSLNLQDKAVLIAKMKLTMRKFCIHCLNFASFTTMDR